MPHYTREFSRTFSVASPTLDVRIVSGAVVVRGEDRADVYVSAKVRFRAYHEEDAEELLRATEAGLFADAERVCVHSPDTDGGSLLGALRHVFGHGRSFEMDVEVYVPRATSLELRLVNGPAEVWGISGPARLHMVNGRTEVADLGGDLSIKHVNGRCDICRIGGSVDLDHTNGAIDIEGAAGNVNLRLVNGRVDIRDAEGAVNARSVSGAFSLTGPIRSDVTVSNSHGKIVLELPRDSRFELDASSGIGVVTSELEVREAGGDGNAPKVRLRSETGKIELRAMREAAPAGV